MLTSHSDNAGANTATDQIAVAEAALQQIPRGQIEQIPVLLCVDSAGASHELLAWAHEANIRFSVGLDLRDNVREQILKIADQDWVAAVAQDGRERPNGQVAEIAGLDLSG